MNHDQIRIRHANDIMNESKHVKSHITHEHTHGFRANRKKNRSKWLMDCDFDEDDKATRHSHVRYARGDKEREEKK